jgi:cation-transporting ATPase E
MLGLYAVVAITPPLRAVFELTLLRGWDSLLLGTLAVGWALLLRFIWRARLFERLLSPETD